MGMTAGLEGSITALAIFLFINSITPGPNNLMLLHGSIKRGFWACRWHMLGITTGVAVMLGLSYWGYGNFSDQLSGDYVDDKSTGHALSIMAHLPYGKNGLYRSCQ
ncbi:LysE family transporter [Psychrobacter alimentarius]|uniref:LysE family transporter n=1 Tax=Psychrobacter alimentarius TaxID=261164 RepID=UPI003FD5FD3B